MLSLETLAYELALWCSPPTQSQDAAAVRKPSEKRVNEIHRPLYPPQPSHAMIPSPTVRTRYPLAFDKDAKLTPSAAVGRWRHFASITSPLTLLASSDDLKRAQKLLKEYQDGVGEGRKAWGHEDQYGVWKAKQCESAIPFSK